MKWEINGWDDIFGIVGIVAIVMIGIVLIFLRRKVRLKGGNDKSIEIGGDSVQPATDGKPVTSLSEMITMQNVSVSRVEASLKSINDTLVIMLKSLSAIDQIQGPQIRSQKITLKFIKREIGREDHDDPINGDLDEAMAEINEANQHYKDMRNVWSKP